MAKLRKKEVTDIKGTLLEFKVGESLFIPFSESQIETKTFTVRFCQMKRKGEIEGNFAFKHCAEPLGTLIFRKK